MGKINWVILVCFFVSVSFWIWKPDLVIEYFAFSGESFLKGRLWTLITSLFLHSNISHLLGNMIFLFVFGNTLEKELKAQKTLAVFFLGGTLSFLLSVFFYDQNIPLIGASAAIFTLISIVMLVKPLKFSFLFLMPQGLVAIVYFLYNLMAVYYGLGGNVAYISHVIGFLVGIPFGIMWSKNWVRNLFITIGLFLAYLAIVYIIQTMLPPFG